MPINYTATASGIHVPTSANDGSNLCLGIKQMGDDIEQLLAPIGTIHEYAGSGDPSGGKWALTDGRALSRTTYAALFAAIGTTYGSGNGTTTFNIPNTAGRTVVSPEPGGSPVVLPNSNRALGQTGGEERHGLTADENGPHLHKILTLNGISGGPSNIGIQYNASGTGQAMQLLNNATSTEGGGTPHNNLQPYIVLNRIIRIA